MRLTLAILAIFVTLVVGCAPHRVDPDVHAVEFSCDTPVSDDIILKDHESCWLKLIRARCGSEDACLATCLARGEGRRIGGGCWHVCGTYRVVDWEEPEGWSECNHAVTDDEPM